MSVTRHLTHPFLPSYDTHSKILILGSFPSVLSVQEGYYYANPKNRFYPLLSRLFQEDFVSCSWEEKKALLTQHHLALYDVVFSCTILGSSDSSMKDIVPIDLPNLLKNTKINLIVCNGTRAYSIYLKNFSHLPIKVLSLPSTSPANAAWTLEKLIQAWSILKINNNSL